MLVCNYFRIESFGNQMSLLRLGIHNFLSPYHTVSTLFPSGVVGRGYSQEEGFFHLVYFMLWETYQRSNPRGRKKKLDEALSQLHLLYLTGMGKNILFL